MVTLLCNRLYKCINVQHAFASIKPVMFVFKHRGVSLEAYYAFIIHVKAGTSGFIASPLFSRTRNVTLPQTQKTRKNSEPI